MSDYLIVEIAKFVVFPGTLFVLLSALFVDWFDRKLFARMQNRIGPRFVQPLYDLLKLLAKEEITPNGVDRPEFRLLPPSQVVIGLILATLVPVYATWGILSFEGDLVFLLFLLAAYGSTIFFIGWVSNNPYTLIGGSRAALAELGFEIPLALALFGPALITGSLRISTVTGTILQKMISLEGVFYLIPWLILFFVAILSATAVIERVPFDPAHAETELTAGWLTELTGRQYAFAKLGALTIEFGLAGVIAGIFLGGPMTYLWSSLLTLFVSDATLLSYLYLPIVYGLGFVVFFIKTIFVVALITGMRTLHGRLRIDQMTSIFWTTLLPLALAGIVLLVILAIPAANYIRAFGF